MLNQPIANYVQRMFLWDQILPLTSWQGRSRPWSSFSKSFTFFGDTQSVRIHASDIWLVCLGLLLVTVAIKLAEYQLVNCCYQLFGFRSLQRKVSHLPSPKLLCMTIGSIAGLVLLLVIVALQLVKLQLLSYLKQIAIRYFINLLNGAR